MTARQVSEAGLNLIRLFESCRLVAYQDQAGVWTLGFGHTGGVQEGDTCTQEQADVWLIDDLVTAEQAVEDAVTQPLNDNQFAALVSFAYNVGAGAFAKSGLVRLINAGEPAQAAQQFVLWDHAGGKVSAGLLRRREAERDLFLTPA